VFDASMGGIMSEWHFMDPASRHNLVTAWEREAAGMMTLADDDTWEGATGAGAWQARDVFGHLVDTTEGYFVSFASARGESDPPENLGVRHMSTYIDEGARAFRGFDRKELVDRLSEDLSRFRSIVDDLSDDQWAGMLVSHKYMGPLPAAFYPLFQLVDYGIHSWDIREGSGKAHALDGDTADLLAPLAFVLWQSTHEEPEPGEPYRIGIRVTGRNGGDNVVSVSPDGVAVEQGDLSPLPTVIEFDPGTLILTAYGRMNGGTVRGDQALAARFLNSCFRI
jgi:uncharacterized protein (TIGR03083 family)